MEFNVKITKTKDSKYYVSIRDYKFFIIPYWKKLTTINESNNKEDILLFDTKEEAKTFLDYIYMI